MWKLLKSLFGEVSQPPHSATPSSSRESRSDEQYTIRGGKVTKTDDVFDAWTSGELNNMLKELNKKTNLIDRHFLLMGIVDQTYKSRSDPKMRDICKTISEQHIQEFARIAPALKERYGWRSPPRYNISKVRDCTYGRRGLRSGNPHFPDGDRV